MSQRTLDDDTSLTSRTLAALEKPTDEAVGLPGEWYSSDHWAREEAKRLFSKVWFCAGFVHELTPGKVVPVDVAAYPIVLTSDAHGTIRAFHNICPHRGFRLVDEDRDRQKIVKCPYHAWAFDLDGTLRSTPHWGGYRTHELDGFDRACHGLKPVRCEVWHQWVFVNVSGDAPALEEYMAPFTAHFEEYDLAGIAHRETAPFSIDGNWKIVEENFLEVIHLPPVHKRLSEYAPFQEHDVVFDGHCIGTVIETGLPASWSSDPLPRFPGVAPDAQNAKNIALFPNLKVVIGPDHCCSMVEFPDGPSRTRQRWDFYFYGDGARDDRFEPARRAIIDFFCETNEEDMGAIAGLQQGRSSPGYEGGVFSKVWEPGVHHFQKLVARYMQGD